MPTRPGRSAVWLLFLGSLGSFAFFAHGYLENTDAQITLQSARAWYLRGDPGLCRAGDEHLLRDGESTWEGERVVANAIAPRDPDARPMYGVTGANGKQYVQFPIGHQLLMLPLVMAGEWLARACPEPERRFAEARPILGQFYWAQFLVSFLPALAAAGSLVVLLAIARVLGACPREALLVVAVATLCTQFWPGASETMSDAPGTFFLLLCALGVLRYVAGGSVGPSLLLAGAAGGAAVLVRYPHAAPLSVLCAWAGVCAASRRRPRDLLWLVAGGLPFAAFLLIANYLRFGEVAETGYSTGANKEWFSYPLWLGLPLALLAPGKGVLWFSPPLWIAFAQYRRRSFWSGTTLVALLVFLVPALVIGHTHGWAGGQCWGVRYLTPVTVLLITVALTKGRPWLRRPRLFAAVCGLGFVVALGGVLAPYRGHQVLALDAARVELASELQSGETTVDLLPDHVNFQPRFSPLHSHWTYAFLSLCGRLDSGRADDTIEPMFGVRSDLPVVVPLREDRGFRHWWMVHQNDLCGLPLWPLPVLLWWAVTTALLVLGVRRYLAETVSEPTPASPAGAHGIVKSPGARGR